MGEWSEEKFQVVEWSIENISSWRNDIHDEAISIPQLEHSEGHLTLYPRGPSGLGEHLVVLISDDQLVSSAELSFIGSDRSVLSTQLINGYDGGDLEISPGLKFEDIAAPNRRNEALHKDKLTLRWRWKMKSPYESVHYKRTEIVVYDTTMKIPLKVFHGFESLNRNKLLSNIEFPLKDGTASQVSLFAIKSVVEDSDIEFVLTPTKIDDGLLVLTTMSLLNNDNTVLWTKENEHIFHNPCMYWTFTYLPWRNSVSKEEFYLLLRVKIIPSYKNKHRSETFSSYSKDIIMMPTSSFEFPNESFCNAAPGNSVTMLTEDLKGLYMDSYFSDFQLRCGNVFFATHKNILCARSPVFKRLLLREPSSSCMDIRDLDQDTLRRFLVFLYTGAADDLLGERALKLYHAAQKYQVLTLRRDCAKALSADLFVSNVCEILSLADKHQDEQLLSDVHQFILENFSEVLGSKEWASCMNTNADLLMKTVVHFAKRKFLGKISIP